MTQQEETVSVAKSTIIFKTTDEWFKTLVSGIVETFFPNRKLTFSIEIKKLKPRYGGFCRSGKPRAIEINSLYSDEGIELAHIIAHEIVHLFTKGGHEQDFLAAMRKIGVIRPDRPRPVRHRINERMINPCFSSIELPTQAFVEKIFPVLEKSGFTPFEFTEAPTPSPDDISAYSLKMLSPTYTEIRSCVKKVSDEEIFSLSKSTGEFGFSISVRKKSDISERQVRQILSLCRFLTGCLFVSKMPMKTDILIRANQPKENIAEYCAYLSKKLAELFGVDLASVCESDYLPFLEGFGTLIGETDKEVFRNLTFKRLV